jgi:hypothetical protein
LTSSFGSKRSSLQEDSAWRSSSDVSDGQKQPAMGYFPPSASRPLRLAAGGGSGSRTPSRAAADRELDDSPFEYAYVNPDTLVPSRHASDPTAGRPHARVKTRSDTSSPASRAGSTQGTIDPFQFITGSARPSPLTSSAPSRRQASPDVSYITSESPTSLRRTTPDSDSGSSLEEHSPMQPPVRVNSSGSGRDRMIEALPASSRREPERRSTRDRSPVPAPSSSKRVTATSQPQRRKSIMGSSTAAKSKRKGK